MKKFIALLSVLIAVPAFQAAPASSESVERLLNAAEAHKMVETMLGQIENSMKTTMNQSLGGQRLTPEAQRISEAVQKKVADAVRTELNWNNLKSMYVQVYTETFSQEEIDGLITFYQSPAGKAFVGKMPQAIQKTMGMMQQRMAPLMKNLQPMVEEAVREAKAAQVK